jgi:L-fuculose-phosphate aldolase
MRRIKLTPVSTDEFMNTPAQLREQICDIGQRLYQRQLVAASDGNISVRLHEHEILCTPTLICKGHMEPDDLCTVTMDGKQVGGRRKMSSEVLVHLEVYRRRADVQSVLHCHPPHVNAFGMTGTPIPACIMPEVELFLGEVPTAPYALTGTPQLAAAIGPFIDQTNIIVLANHGTVSFGESVEQALWWAEILDAYCRTLLLSQSLGAPQLLTNGQVRELLEAKKKWGLDDPRSGPDYQDADLSQRPLFGDC